MTDHAQRAPQQDRSRATRTALLEAAVLCLAEHGWSGSTVTVVAERAGVSRGAAQHHFPTRESLFIAAVEHVAAERSAEIRRRAAERSPDGQSAAEVVRLVVELHTGPLFRAALGLWVASASETELRREVVELEGRLGRELHRTTVALLGADETRPGVRASVQATLDLARGLGLANLLTDDSARRAGIVEQWAAMLQLAVEPTSSSAT